MLNTTAIPAKSYYQPELPATPQEVEDVLQWVDNERAKWERNGYSIAPQYYKRILSFVRNELVKIAETLKSSAERKSGFSLRIEARRAIAELKNTATSLTVVPQEKSNIKRQIVDLTPGSSGNLTFSLPPKGPSQEVPEKVAALFNHASEVEHVEPLVPFAQEALIGLAEHALHHTLGKGRTRALQVGIKCQEGEGGDSLNPKLDRVLSATAKVAIEEIVGFCVKRYPAYLVVGSIHSVGKAGAEVQEGVEEFIANHPEEEFSQIPIGEGINPNHAAQFARAVLQTAQIPAQVLEEVEHAAVHSVSNMLDAFGINDANIEKAGKTLKENLKENIDNLQLPTQFP